MNELEQYIEEVRNWCEEVLSYTSQLEVNEEIRDIVYRVNLLLGRIDYQHRDIWELVSVFSEEVDVIEEMVVTQKEKRNKFKESTPTGKHILPPLPYPYHGLEPYICEEIMFLHHTAHHQSYIDGLNEAEIQLQHARENGDYHLLKHWERELAFHGSGHYLHSIFWKNMCQNGSEGPKGELLERIEYDFESFPAFKAQFTQVANKVEGSGWAILAYSRQSKKLVILQSEKHQNLTQWDTVPLLVIDVWEHAYYLQYKNKKIEYIQNWWHVVDWENVNERFEEAKEKGISV